VAGLTVTLAVTAAALAGCGGASSTDRPAAASSSAAPSATATASALPRASTQAQCEARPDTSGDILVRTTTNGQPAATQQLGGAWTWDTRTSTCTTAADAIISTASTNAGNCTEVAYASSNPGYQLTVSPAPPLRKVVASKGPAC
jgi:hypothetical protein